MFVSFLSHVICAWFAFALPCYATYKALRQPPSPDALHTLAVYWTVAGSFVALEQSLAPFLSWLPFYWELRTLFLLYISLPQTNGSAYVYKSFLEPWLSQNERDIDDAVAAAQSNIIAFCRTRITALIDLVRALLNNDTTPNGDPNAPAGPLDHLKGLVLTALAPRDSHVNN